MGVGYVRGLIAASALLATTGACDGTVRGCDADLWIRIDPAERVLAPSESFKPSVALRGCGGTEKVSDVFTWAAQDTTIVRVEASTGRTTALRIGETTIIPTGKTHGPVGEVLVRVRAHSR